jgi:hypothetical protein
LMRKCTNVQEKDRIEKFMFGSKQPFFHLSLQNWRAFSWIGFLWYNPPEKDKRKKEDILGLNTFSLAMRYERGFFKPRARSSNTCPSTYKRMMLHLSSQVAWMPLEVDT